MKNQYDILNDATVDFSAYEVSELNEKELNAMKNVIKTPKKRVLARVGAIAACVGLVAAVGQTSFAKEFIDNIIKTLSTGTNKFYQVDLDEAEMPEELQIFYDENGKLITTYHDGQVFYDKDGNELKPEDMRQYLRDNGVTDYVTEDGNGEITISYNKDEDPLKRYEESGYSIIDNEADMAKLNDALDFAPRLPEYLPKGYGFYGAAYFDTSRYYLTVIYKNGDKYIYVNERLINDETAFSMGTDEEIEELEINGHKAVLSGDRNLDWEDGDVSVGINGGVGRDEIIKIGESVK